MANDRQLAVLDSVRNYQFTGDHVLDGDQILQDIVNRKKEQLQKDLSEFFCDEIHDDFDLVTEVAEEQVVAASVVPIETEIKAFKGAKDPTFTDSYQTSQVTFEKIKQKDIQRKNEDLLHFDTPTVEAEIISGGGKGSYQNASSSYANTSRYQSAAPTQSAPQPAQAAPGAVVTGKPKHIFEAFDHFAKSAQNAAYNNKFNAPPQKQDDGWGRYAKKSWWQKTKDFVKSAKFKTGVKVAAMLGLQLGMAVIGKKYEVNGMGEAAMFIGCMMGVFFLSKELHKEGIDARAFGF